MEIWRSKARGDDRHLPTIGIGEAARLYGLTLRALRLYEEVGLVTARRDRYNVRYYDAASRRRLGWISLLRSAGISLSDMGEVLEAEDGGGDGAACAVRKLAARRRELEIELALVDLAAMKLRPGVQAAPVVDVPTRGAA